VSHVIGEIGSALGMAFVMGWEILWPLVLGFALSGIVQAVVTKGEMSRLLPDSSARTILIASGLGAASSSCSYVAIALARSLFRKGADFIAAMAFEFASTNLVLELGIIVWVLMGWQFTLAEFIGGPVMIVLLVLLLRRAMTPALLWLKPGRRPSAGSPGVWKGMPRWTCRFPAAAFSHAHSHNAVSLPSAISM